MLYVDEHGETECIACPNVTIVLEANLQKEELRKEEEKAQVERTLIYTQAVCELRYIFPQCAMIGWGKHQKAWK